MTDDLRFGVIGSGMMGCEHIRNLDALDGAIVVAIADPDPGSRDEALAAATGPVAAFDHVDGLLAAVDSGAVGLDAVVIATPNHTHRSTIEPLWETNLHMMIEKPLCTTVEDCLAVRDRATNHDGLVWMGLEYRYMPAVTQFVERVAAGDAGTLHMLSIREHRFPFLAKVGNWNRFARNTGNTLVEKCCHFFDLMNLILGERPTQVCASGGQNVNHLDEIYDGEVPDIVDNAFVIVEYPSGARALLDLCMFAEGSRWEQELCAVGDRGKVEAHLPNFMESFRGRTPELIVGSRGPEWPVTDLAVEPDPTIGYVGAHHGASFLELARFCDAVRSGGPPEVTLDDGLWSVAMGVAAHRSIAEGRPVTLAEVGAKETS